jgi:hypothetical protein
MRGNRRNTTPRGPNGAARHRAPPIAAAEKSNSFKPCQPLARLSASNALMGIAGAVNPCTMTKLTIHGVSNAGIRAPRKNNALSGIRRFAGQRQVQSWNQPTFDTTGFLILVAELSSDKTQGHKGKSISRLDLPAPPENPEG